jgi:hypothetical protein
MIQSGVYVASIYPALFAGTVDLLNDDIRMMLVDNTYEPDFDNDVDIGDVVASEVTGTGYTAYGQALTGLSVSYNEELKAVIFDANDPSWASSTITARGAVVYIKGTTDAESPLILYINFTENKSSTAGTFTVSIPASGILQAVNGRTSHL